MRSTHCLTVVAVVAATLLFVAAAGAGEANTDDAAHFDHEVLMVTPDTLEEFLDVHPPAFLLIYAPWCRHSTKLRPDYAKFAAGTSSLIQVGAINADAYPLLAKLFKVEGYPTIVQWGVGPKWNAEAVAPDNWEHYKGGRSANGLLSVALGLIDSKNVRIATRKEQLENFVAHAPREQGIVLFTRKEVSPHSFSLLSTIPSVENLFVFVAVPQSASHDAGTFLHPPRYPSLAHVVKKASTGTKVAFDHTFYSGDMRYADIVDFVMKRAGLANGTGAEATEIHPSERRPRPLTHAALQRYCGRNVEKVHGYHPYCIVSFGGKTHYDLDAVHKQFETDPLVFFEVDEAVADEVAEAFNDEFRPQTPVVGGDVMLIRSVHGRILHRTFYKMNFVDDMSVSLTQHFVEFLHRSMSGQVTFEKSPRLPDLKQLDTPLDVSASVDGSVKSDSL